MNFLVTNLNIMTTTTNPNTSIFGPSGSSTASMIGGRNNYTFSNAYAAIDTPVPQLATSRDIEKISQRLETIEKILYIPARDIVMEEKYANLKRIYEAYTEELEALKTWEILQESA